MRGGGRASLGGRRLGEEGEWWEERESQIV